MEMCLGFARVGERERDVRDQDKEFIWIKTIGNLNQKNAGKWNINVSRKTTFNDFEHMKI
jgi:hypothetical protein